jgi:coenzyme F420-0:L-glutamate ligase / coenzyme F420-1:gamma-L-glutamate ligase
MSGDARRPTDSGADPSRFEVIALPTAHRFHPGDDLLGPLMRALTDAGITLADGDVICVVSKAVALSEGALLDRGEGASASTDREGVRELARARAREIVADGPWVTITRTHHGFVAANGGIDRSNVPGGAWLDLPVDPDASAAALRTAIAATTGRDVAVVITDTFGRPWRLGQTDVALGAAGLSVLRDERGDVDLEGRTLEVTLGATGDAVAGAADLVRAKASGTPFVLVRGLSGLTAAGGAETGTGADLVRPLEEDLFRRGGAEAVLHGLTARRTVRRFDTARPIPDAAIVEAVTVASTAPAPHHSRPWRFVRLSDSTRPALLDAMAKAWRADLLADGVDEATIDARLVRSDALHRDAPVLLAAFVDLSAAHPYRDARRTRAERDLFVLSGGAAIEALMVALAARGLGAAWTSSTTFCPEIVQESLGLPADWEPLGTIAIGWPVGPREPRSGLSSDGLLEER